MAQLYLTDRPEIAVDLRVSARAKRLSLRVSRLDGQVKLSMPKGVSQRQAQRFADSQADWIAKALANQVVASSIAIGGALPVEGQLFTVVSGPKARLSQDSQEIFLPAGREGPAAKAVLKELCRQRAMPAIDRYAAQLGKNVGRISFRDTRSRWGSCSGAGNLMFSWRLIMAPPPVLDYVVAHEVAHLVHMDHSPRFWDVVDQICPAYKAHRKWLRSEGHLLHRYRFS